MSLESRRSTRGWCHGTTTNRLSERCRHWRVKVIVIFVVVAHLVGIGVVFRPVVLLVVCFSPGLAFVKVFLVERPDSVGTLLGVVSWILWGQRSQPESHPSGVATSAETVVVGCLRGIDFGYRWWFGDRGIIINPGDIHGRNRGIGFSVITVVTVRIA